MLIYDYVMKDNYKYENQIAISNDNTNISYQELVDIVDKYCNELKKNGIQHGDFVVIWLENSCEFIYSLLAINKIGAVAVPIHFQTGINKIKQIIQEYEIEHIIINENLDKIGEVLRYCAITTVIYVGSSEIYGQKYYTEKNKTKKNNRKVDNDLALILLTSGTTNNPKGVMLSNKNIISNISSISDYLKLSIEDNLLIIKNFTHSSSITGEILVAIYNKCTIHITKKILTANVITEIIYKKKITVFFAVPYLLSTIINNKLNKEYIKSIRCINFYGAPISRNVLEKLMNFFEISNLIYSYGLTEASPRVTYIEKNEMIRKNGSSGKCIKNVDVYIMDEGGTILSNNRIGEICIKGDNVMLGYYNNEELTSKKIKQGILYTGDLGYLDEEGYLYVIGRKDNMIIQSGKNIYPEEIESVINGYEPVIESRVYGEDNEKLGEIVVTEVVLKKDYYVSGNNIIQYCMKYLEDYKIPRVIKFVDKIQKNNNGKIIRGSITVSEPII